MFVDAINHAAEAWGIRCMRYEIKDIQLPTQVREAMQMQVCVWVCMWVCVWVCVLDCANRKVLKKLGPSFFAEFCTYTFMCHSLSSLSLTRA